eukprot:GILI01026401.1.p1 GENE.GILI01026401.1~~GILI01026401.1.p1  ORF type:complete len:342 (-),score=84.83 GILI01026401.1:47-994(-)
MSSAFSSRRALHWVFKVGDLKKTVDFHKELFNLKVLRHEEFESGCAATCNGPYGGAWSKTMIGTGEEKSHFALELTYNYGISSYAKGDDLQFIALRSNDVAAVKSKAESMGYEVIAEEGNEGCFSVRCPDGHLFKVVPESDLLPTKTNQDPFLFVSIKVKNLENAKNYWQGVLGMEEFPRLPGCTSSTPSVLLGFGQDQTKLELQEDPDHNDVSHADAFGRIAFMISGGVTSVYEAVLASSDTIQNHPVRLDTPGKATVEVVILKDRDGYEICFVEELGFVDLSTTKEGDDFIDWAARDEKLNASAPPLQFKFKF